MAPRKQKHLDPAIHHVPLGRLRVFHISEAQLEELERGSTESIYFNFAIGVLSVAISFTATLATATFTSDRAFYVAVIIMVIGYLAGAVLFRLWFVDRKSLKRVSSEIRSRIPPKGEQATDDDPKE